MSETGPGSSGNDRDLRIVTDAFAAFRETSRDAFPPPPVASVYATAHRRQRLTRRRGWLATAAAVLPAILLLLGSTTLLSMAGGDDRRPTGNGRATVDATVPGSPQASGSRSPGPGTSTRSRQPTRPRGGIQVDLASATINLPAVAGCPGGVLAFAAGRATDPAGCGWQVGIWPARYANLDGVAGQETVTRFTAGATSGVVALRPPAAGTRPRVVQTMGYVMTADPGVESVAWVEISSSGLITVGLSGGDAAGTSQQGQSYRWDPSAQAFLLLNVPTQPPDTDPPGSVPPDPQPSALEPSLSASPSP
jgi:hypothetical protein